MKKTAFIFLMCIPFSLVAQGGQDSASVHKDRWSVEVALGLTVACHTDNISYTGDAYNKKIKLRPDVTASIHFKISKLLSLTGDVCYTNLGYRYTRMHVPPYVPEPYLFIATYDYSLFGGGLFMKCNFRKNRLMSFFGLGPKYLVLINNERYYNDGIGYSEYDTGEGIYFASICAGANFQLTKRVGIGLEIVGNWGLTYIRHYSVANPGEYRDNYLKYGSGSIGLSLSL